MSNGITLTSAMRNNLGALKYLSGQMDITQTRLATGQKVNSAIDNASSFYQARALTNRAGDLDRLLDSMGQSIQTINAAISGLEQAGATLEQAAVVAQQAYEAAIIPEKAWFEAQVGENGAVVSTAQELKDAINANKETICVYGKIDYFENQTLTMKANQKLVGTEYFTGYTGNKKYSEINFTGTQYAAIRTANNGLISDLELNFDAIRIEKNLGRNLLICGESKKGIVLNNLDLSRDIQGTDSYQSLNGVISFSYTTGKVDGVINIKSQGQSADAISVHGGSKLEIAEKAVVNININEIKTSRSAIYIYADGNGKNTQMDIYGKVNIKNNSSGSFDLAGGSSYCGNTLTIHDGAEVTMSKYVYVGSRKDENTYNSVNIEAGAKVNIKDSRGEAELISQGYSLENNTASGRYLYSTTLANSGNFTPSGATIDWDNFANTAVGSAGDEVALNKIAGQYGEMMSAYDDMIKDSSYQGINLLTGGSLTTMFNENRTHSFVVQGEDMRSNALGITTREWQTRDDIAASIKEIKAAMSKVRDMVESLGNNLSIIQTRENFTDKLIDVLQTGADDLVLADMNEESANYLALQTRNNLAVNALALAAQSSSAVLKLF